CASARLWRRRRYRPAALSWSWSARRPGRRGGRVAAHHRRGNALLGGGAARELGDDAALAHDQDAGAHAPDRLEPAGDHQYGEAAAGQFAHQAVDLCLGTHVDAARRLVEDEDPGLARQPLAEHDLLLVAARELVDDLRNATGADAEAPDRVFG